LEHNANKKRCDASFSGKSPGNASHGRVRAFGRRINGLRRRKIV
jgi:hypothetical protein